MVHGPDNAAGRAVGNRNPAELSASFIRAIVFMREDGMGSPDSSFLANFAVGPTRVKNDRAFSVTGAHLIDFPTPGNDPSSRRSTE